MWESKYSLARHFLTKVTVLISSLDDIYDVKATIDQLELFTATITRWGKAAGDDDLPEYMGHWMEAMTGVIDGIDDIVSKEGRGYCVEYLKLALKNQAKAYLSEARWLARKVVPSVEEYREVFEWLLADPAILVASSDMCRLTDDVVSHEFEQERKHAASSVEFGYTHSTKDTKDVITSLLVTPMTI
ncbi:unnamed protein product [Linum trigynum]|uniref:Terpene synthase metal-binding domain-containing protein n=1 Tax=Linum trigynum TaxID=586398 RepID=A0AAV2F6L9_9ROSI